MSDTQSILSALGAMPRKQREEFLGMTLSQQPVEALEAILKKLDLKELPVNSKVGLVFGMGLSPVAHAFRGGPARELRWVIPQVPDHLRPLVYATSRLINEFQETLLCLQNGRGDFAKALALLNPETMLGMVTRFTDEMQTYTQQLRDANGRFNRNGPARGRRGAVPRTPRAEEPAAEGATEPAATPPAEAESAPGQKTRRTATRSKTKVQDASPEGSVPVADAPTEEPPASSGAEEAQASPGMDAQQEQADAIRLSETELAAFGFDIQAVASGIEGHPSWDKSEE
jgi:hypothetical protein